MNVVKLAAFVTELVKRMLPEGGFSTKPGGKYRTDATAWAVTALSLAGKSQDVLKPARDRLASTQLENGMVPFSADHPDTIWTTPLAILAWRGANEYSSMRDRAINFLLKTAGAYDSALKGWPWTLKAHSWAEPTALSVIALRVTGYETHQRVREAVLMLMDRQLPKGGWNFGSTIIFGRELYPMPEMTGMVLASLADIVPKISVEKSLSYLRSNIGQVRTPIALGWSLLALSAYGERPEDAERLIVECFNNQKRYGTYDTAMLSLLILAFVAKDGMINALKQKGH